MARPPTPTQTRNNNTPSHTHISITITTINNQQSTINNQQSTINNKTKPLQASSAYKHSLKEVLALPAVAAQVKDTKAAREVAALGEFFAMLSHDSARAFYGPGHVLAAAELGAVQTLLISGERVMGAGGWLCWLAVFF